METINQESLFTPMTATSSENAFKAAKDVLVGGVNSPVRSFNSVGGTPVFFERGSGAFLYDLDEKPYLDYVLSWGALILGHAPKCVTAALHETLVKGTSFGAPTVLETKLANLVTECVPFLEKVRMVNSGTEAVMSLIRLARGYTKRSKIIKFRGCYHGHGDSFLVEAGSGVLTLGIAASPGVTAGAAKDTLIAEFNDISSVKEHFTRHPGEIAAVLLEPVTGNMGVVLPETQFLTALRTLTEEKDALLIFDEVMTGFRVGLGGVSMRLGVTPDLLALGKIIGGGLPAALYGGRAEIMDHVAPLGPVYQAGTLSGNPLAMASGLATLTELRTHEQNHYGILEKHGHRLETGLNAIATELKVPMVVTRMGSMMTVFFTTLSKMRNFNDVTSLDANRYGQFFHAMLKQGIYLPPSPYEAWFLSIAHKDADISKTLTCAQRALSEIISRS
ncbi:glutamate-1-semialdehyde 2,1-aminomutase [Spirochaetota bacterium]|nr:glutamate-1-semialdehyde 2,1-aminomutase [Spirochaetota bacterium]